MKKLMIALLVCPFLLACGTKVKRMEIEQTKDVSGSWNDTDSREVAKTMIDECLNGAWYAKALKEKKGADPVVIVGTVRNDSMEHINTNTFIEELQRALINSGKVEFVASKDERGNLREERLDQDEYSSEATRKAFGKEVGMAVGAAAALVWFLPQLTTLFLGPQWHTCGVYAQILCGAMVLSFVANSLSGMFIVANKLRQLFYWQLYFVTTTIAAILVGGLVYKSMIVTIALFSILRASAYLLSIIMTYHYTVVNVEK